jgi:DNA-binding NarL/FixJ family response regulator
VIRIFIADDHAIFRQGLKRILADEADCRLVGEATNGDDLLSQLPRRPCEIVLLDLSMPGRGGIGLVRDVHEAKGGHKIIVLSMHEEHQYIVEALKAGAVGYVTKNSASDQLIQAIRKVSRGEVFVSAAASHAAVKEARTRRSDLPHTRLTPREREVFDLLIAGRKMSLIARDLGLSIKTVSTHKANLLSKMDANSTADLVRYAMLHQLD